MHIYLWGSVHSKVHLSFHILFCMEWKNSLDRLLKKRKAHWLKLCLCNALFSAYNACECLYTGVFTQDYLILICFILLFGKWKSMIQSHILRHPFRTHFTSLTKIHRKKYRFHRNIRRGKHARMRVLCCICLFLNPV